MKSVILIFGFLVLYLSHVLASNVTNDGNSELDIADSGIIGAGCSICMGDKSDFLTRCNHHFHKNCLELWFRLNHPSCPECRKFITLNCCSELLLNERKFDGINVTDEELDDIFGSIATFHYKEGVINALLPFMRDRNWYSDQMFTLLRLIPRNELICCAQQLIEQNDEINSKDENGTTALMKAIISKDIRIAQLLLNNNADANIKTLDGNTCLIIAASDGHVGLVRLLLSHCADLDEKNEEGETALLCASEHNYFHIIELLLYCGASISDKDKNGFTPLMWTAFHGQTEMFELLLGLGANFDEKNIKGRTALFIGASRGSTDIVTLLLTRGSNVNEKDANDDTPLIIAVKRGHLNVVEQLLIHEAKVNEKNKNGVTALMFAAKVGHFSVVESLVKRGAIINEKDNSDATPLFYAIKRGYIRTVEFLLSRGANIKDESKYDSNAFTLAVQENSPGILQLLIMHDASLDEGSVMYWTGLARSAFFDQYENVKRILLEHSNLTGETSFYNEIILRIAVERKNIGIIRLLLVHETRSSEVVLNEKGFVYSRALELLIPTYNPLMPLLTLGSDIKYLKEHIAGKVDLNVYYRLSKNSSFVSVTDIQYSTDNENWKPLTLFFGIYFSTPKFMFILNGLKRGQMSFLEILNLVNEPEIFEIYR